METSFIHRAEVLSAFRALFCAGYGVPEPVVALDRVVHWQAQAGKVRALAGPPPRGLGQRPTRLFGGYLYNFSSPVPRVAEIEAALAAARRDATPQVMVPTVPDAADAAPLRAAGFEPVPCFVEAIVDAGGGDADAVRRQVVGGARFRELGRAVRRADECCAFEWMPAGKLAGDAALLDEVARLHALNIVQHGLDVNFYHAGVLRAVQGSALEPAFIVGLHRDRATGRAVQALISLSPPGGGEFHTSAQGIDHAVVPRPVNLYAAGLHRLCCLASAGGARTIYLGRGNAAEMRRLGANRFRLLNHWMWGQTPEIRAEIATLADLSRRALQPEWGECRAWMGDAPAGA